MPDFTIKVGDNSPDLQVVLKKDVDGVQTAIDLTGYTVVFSMRPKGSSALSIDDGACNIAADQVADKGEVSYPAAGFSAIAAGDYLGEFRATSGGGKITRFPRDQTNKYLEIKILPQIVET